MIKKLLIVLVLLGFVSLAGIVMFGLMLPPDWFVIRDTVVNAPPERIYPLFADFNHWEQWSPWKEKDPQMKVAIPGKTAGVGAYQTWESPTQGSGRTEITEAARDHFIATHITLHGNWESAFDARLELQKRQDGKTVLRWVAFGREEKLFPKLMAQVLFDRFMGPDFEAGLAGIKKLAESHPAD